MQMMAMMLRWILAAILAFSVAILAALLGFRALSAHQLDISADLCLIFAIATYAFPLSVMVSKLLPSSRIQSPPMDRWILSGLVWLSVCLSFWNLSRLTRSSRCLMPPCIDPTSRLRVIGSFFFWQGSAIRSGNTEYMPLLLSLFNFLNVAVWSAYSIVTRDIVAAVKSRKPYLNCMLRKSSSKLGEGCCFWGQLSGQI